MSTYQTVDGLIWWFVETAADAATATQKGWLAQNTPTGVPLLREVEALERG